MDRFGLIGFPIAHSLSPRLFTAAYHGRYQYDLIETPDFDEAWRRFLEGCRSVNVTAPFKGLAYDRADWHSPECIRVGATNLLLKSDDGIKAYNSDYLGVKALLESLLVAKDLPGEMACVSPGSCRGAKTAAIIGFGGAGKAAMAAAEDSGLETRLYRHDEIATGLNADIVIYTLPKPVEGIDRIECRAVIEANYKDPCLSSHEGYIPGTAWHLQQAVLGYSIMSGEVPDVELMKQVYLS